MDTFVYNIVSCLSCINIESFLNRLSFIINSISIIIYINFIDKYLI